MGIGAYAVGAYVGRTAALDVASLKELFQEKANLSIEYQNLEKLVAMNKAKLKKLEKFEETVARLAKEVSSEEAALNSLRGQVAEKRRELQALIVRVEKTKSRPVELPAGHFDVGVDIRAGRYSVVGRSNFVVRSGDGGIKVNTILGDGDFGVRSYVCRLEEGDSIQAESAIRCYPID